jgi:hypothetical protein
MKRKREIVNITWQYVVAVLCSGLGVGGIFLARFLPEHGEIIGWTVLGLFIVGLIFLFYDIRKEEEEQK